MYESAPNPLDVLKPLLRISTPIRAVVETIQQIPVSAAFPSKECLFLLLPLSKEKSHVASWDNTVAFHDSLLALPCRSYHIFPPTITPRKTALDLNLLPSPRRLSPPRVQTPTGRKYQGRSSNRHPLSSTWEAVGCHRRHFPDVRLFGAYPQGRHRRASSGSPPLHASSGSQHWPARA